MSQDMIGTKVQWEKRGRGTGQVETGIVLAHAPPGTRNDTVFDKVKEKHSDEYVFRPTYQRFSDSTHSTSRYIVAVEKEVGSRGRTVHWFYAPNTLDVIPA